MWLWTVCVSLILQLSSRPGYASCGPGDAPTIEDSCYARTLQTARLSWIPPRSCDDANKYEVLYTQCTCNTSDSTMSMTRVQHSGSVILTSPETDNYCIRVRAVINDSFHSNYSICAQVGSMEEDQLSNVMMHGDLCIPATLCHDDQHPSKVILRNPRIQELSHLTWRRLDNRPDVNVMYNSTTDTNYFCFHNVTNNFLILEYCEESKVSCARDSSFCCNWLKFVTRTCVNVNGNGGCSDSLLKPSVAPSRVIGSLTPDSSFITSTSSMLPCTATDVMISNTSTAIPNTPSGDNNLALLSLLSLLLLVIAVILLAVCICCRHHK